MRLIDADVLTKEIKRLSVVMDSPYWEGRKDGREDALIYISKQRTVDAEPVRHGRWKEVEKDLYFYYIGCSSCKGRVPKDEYGNNYYSEYCPNCGAKMDLGDDEN